MKFFAFISATFAAIFLLVASAASEDFRVDPDSLTLEAVHGDLTRSFSMQELRDMGEVEVKAVSPWTDGVATFEGTPLARVAEAMGAEDGVVVMTALNNYQVEMPLEALLSDGAVLAQRLDGERLQVSEKGPLWLVFPSAERRELAQAETVHRWIWQLARIRFAAPD
jgi:hypothetical protein